MCINDWRAGRLIRSIGRTVPANVVAAGTILPMQQRVGLYIAGSLTADLTRIDVTIGGVDIPVNNSMGFGIFPFFTMQQHGDLPTRQFKLVGNVANTGVFSIVEFFMPEEMIAACLEQFKRDNLKCLT